MGEEFYFLYQLKPFTRRRAGYFSPVLCRRKLDVALLRLRLRSLPQTKIPRRFGRVKGFLWYRADFTFECKIPIAL